MRLLNLIATLRQIVFEDMEWKNVPVQIDDVAVSVCARTLGASINGAAA
jgi:hypothetical protein